MRKEESALEPAPLKLNIFGFLHDAMKEKALKKLRFAKCDKCGLFTPYRLKHVTNNTVICKKCGASIKLNIKEIAF
jgi:formylmethanofuran dehydrogenase subunit E